MAHFGIVAWLWVVPLKIYGHSKMPNSHFILNKFAINNILMVTFWCTKKPVRFYCLRLNKY